MPYASNADLPAPVRNALPAAAQTIFRKAFNAALETYKNDEGKAAAVAWSAVAKAGYHKGADGKWVLAAKQTGVDAVPRKRIFLNALESYEVTYAPTPEGKWLVKGLPLIRVGTWNGQPYTAEDLQQIAGNLSRRRDDEAFTPGIWPKHNYDHDGNSLPQDASAVLGYYQELYLDGSGEALLGDVEVFDEETAQDMARGKLRYVSAEIRRTDDLGMSLNGAAFVHEPAVKGLPWHMVINSADYRQSDTSQATRSGQTLPPKGGKSMSIKDKLLAFIGAAKSDDPEVLSQAAEEIAAELMPKAEPTTAPPAEEPIAVVVDNPTQEEALRRQYAHERKTREDLETEIRVLKQQFGGVQEQQRHDRAEHLVAEWRKNGWLSPAAMAYAQPLAERCLEQGEQKVAVLAEDGNIRKEEAIYALAEILRLTSPEAITMSARGAVWNGEEDPDAVDEGEAEAVAAKMAALVNEPKVKPNPNP